VPGGDYGFEFRYGRTGMHPLQAWDGELPGTLGMVAGVGEAPCAVVWQRGRFFVSSWRDHQIQMYTLVPHGASFTATMEPLVTGPESFRPTGIAFAPDGSLYVNDWGSASYSVNGKGCIWKLTFTKPATGETEAKPNDAMLRAERLRKSDNLPDLLAGLDDNDPAIAQAAQFGLSHLPQAEKIDFEPLDNPRQRIGLLAALLMRGTDVQPQVLVALKDPDDRVRQMAVRAVAEQNIKAAKPALEELLNSQVLSPRLLGMTIAALNQLDGDRSARIDPKKANAILLARLKSPEATDQTKATALHMLQSNHPPIDMESLARLSASKYVPLELEAIRYLSGDADPGRFACLENIAYQGKDEISVRAEAIDGLSDDAAHQISVLIDGTESEETPIRQESLRSLKSAVPTMNKAQLDRLAQVAQKFPADADLVHRILGQPLPARPPETDIAAWQKILDKAPGDPDAGRRIFFHPAMAGCYRCHMVEGRGRAIGPDLTMIGHSQTREHVLESILDPSKEIAPLFTLWSIKVKSGDQIDGMLLRRDGQSREVYVDASGKETTVNEPDVVDRRIRKESLMPTGLVQGMTDQELRDLVSFLMQKR
jgi:putative heme-binding domain-containing protein